ncbi:MAG: hypothetical protein K2N43_04585 [Lachnospiraceae bacterium]|nr:hypothetical protein [Lachnospiraceae bacterium]
MRLFDRLNKKSENREAVESATLEEDVSAERLNEYQKLFFEHIANMQETAVEITLGQHKLYEHEQCDKIRDLLYDATSNVLYYFMELIDGYSTFSQDKMDIINSRTKQGLKEKPFIELHDEISEYIREGD